MKRLALIGGLSVILAACSSTPMNKEEPVLTQESVKKEVTERLVKPVEANKLDSNGLPLILTDGKSILSQRSVYFDFDKFSVKPEYQEMLTAHAKFLKENKGFKILIQGNSDERGGREYNLALGQKRAEAVKKVLTLLGANDTQIEAVSLGEEKPKKIGNGEESWSENRRGDILYRNDQDRGEF